MNELKAPDNFGFLPPAHKDENAVDLSTSASSEVETRTMQRIQASVLMARRFPRNEAFVAQNILRSCQRQGLAERAIYSYPRGDTTVEGESIYLVREIAKHWGNLDYGINILYEDDERAEGEAYCWDMQSNVYTRLAFTVKFERHTRKGVKKITDPRDKREMFNNIASRSVRNCIKYMIPDDIISMAKYACEQTLRNDGSESLEDKIDKIINAFSEFNVTKPMLEAHLKHSIESISVNEYVALKKLYSSIKHKYCTVEEIFEAPPVQGAAIDIPKESEVNNGHGVGVADLQHPSKVEEKTQKMPQKTQNNAKNDSLGIPADNPNSGDNGELSDLLGDLGDY